MIPSVPVELAITSKSVRARDNTGRITARPHFDAWTHVARRDVALVGFTDADELVIVRRVDLERLQAVRS